MVSYQCILHELYSLISLHKHHMNEIVVANRSWSSSSFSLTLFSVCIYDSSGVKVDIFMSVIVPPFVRRCKMKEGHPYQGCRVLRNSTNHQRAPLLLDL